MSLGINSEKLNKLLPQIEEIRRRKIVNAETDDTVNYIDSSENLARLSVHNNHILYGRRGSGKTTLMSAAIKNSSSDFPIVYDLQPIRNMDADTIIIKLVLKMLTKIQGLIRDDYLVPAEMIYKSQYKGIKGIYAKITRKRDVAVLDKYQRLELFYSAVGDFIGILNKIESTPSEVTYKIGTKMATTSSMKQKNEKVVKFQSETKLKGEVKASYELLSTTINNLTSMAYNSTNTVEQEKNDTLQVTVEVEDSKTVTKTALIDNVKEALVTITNEFFDLTQKHIVLYLDDFYQISLIKQPRILQYLHDIYKNSKNNSFCFKVSTLPHRLRMNNEGESNFSHKDDYSPINLDNDLSEIDRQKKHLLRIVCSIDPSLELSLRDIESLFSSEDALNYSLVATGGIPRDFLIMFGQLVKATREDQRDSIGKEHIYSVVRELRADKDNNNETDSDLTDEELRAALNKIEKEIIGQLNTNVILYPTVLAKQDERLLNNLVNLRYLHVIKESTSSEKRKKEEFVAYLVDMSFYVTQKQMKRGFVFRQFWAKDSGHRRKQLDSAPIWSFSGEHEKLMQKV
ncbi:MULTISPECIES: hypothetical protein [Paenibacillus]|uniref:hypothetical protein n=1 Tax=Paenibacillus TaxID=44249 RepID=UPI002FE1D29B